MKEFLEGGMFPHTCHREVKEDKEGTGPLKLVLEKSLAISLVTAFLKWWWEEPESSGLRGEREVKMWRQEGWTTPSQEWRRRGAKE